MTDFTPHTGKSNFRSARPVRVQYRNGQESKQVIPANQWRAKDRDWQSDWDIIGARVEEV